MVDKKRRALIEHAIQSKETTRGKLEAEVALRPSTGTFANDSKGAKSLTGRLAWSPAIGHELAGSFYWGRYTPQYLKSEKPRLVSNSPIFPRPNTATGSKRAIRFGRKPSITLSSAGNSLTHSSFLYSAGSKSGSRACYKMQRSQMEC